MLYSMLKSYADETNTMAAAAVLVGNFGVF